MVGSRIYGARYIAQEVRVDCPYNSNKTHEAKSKVTYLVTQQQQRNNLICAKGKKAWYTVLWVDCSIWETPRNSFSKSNPSIALRTTNGLNLIYLSTESHLIKCTLQTFKQHKHLSWLSRTTPSSEACGLVRKMSRFDVSWDTQKIMCKPLDASRHYLFTYLRRHQKSR